jgi:hypothetical protein
MEASAWANSSTPVLSETEISACLIMRNYQNLNKAGRGDTKLIPVLWRTSAAVRRGAQKN